MEHIRRFLGKPICDLHGRAIGKVVGISTNIKNEVASVEVELGNGDFMQCPACHITVDSNYMVLLQPWKVEAVNLQKELNLVTRRLQALDELHSARDIQEDIYQDLRNQHQSVIEGLEERRRNLVTDLNRRVDGLSVRIKELETVLANNKMQYTSGEIDGEAYKITCDSIHSGLDRVFSERKDIQAILEYLEKLDAAEPIPKPSVPPPPEQRKEIPNVVVVRMRE